MCIHHFVISSIKCLCSTSKAFEGAKISTLFKLVFHWDPKRFLLYSSQVLEYFCEYASEVSQEALIYWNSKLLSESSIWQNCTWYPLYPMLEQWTLKASWDGDERFNYSKSFCDARLASRKYFKMSRTKFDQSVFAEPLSYRDTGVLV